MESLECLKLRGFYENELKQNILGYWLPRCLDQTFGGFLNCYNNYGDRLVSYDKYAWSQGRFVWLFARLAATAAPLFTRDERRRFLSLAAQGADFLMKHCLLGPNDWRVSFLMERDGSPKSVSPGAPLDMSIYADCFVVAGLAMYAFAGTAQEPYAFAKKLYGSILDRVRRRDFHTLPYPLSDRFRAHGIPMILSNVTRELYRAAGALDPGYCDTLRSHLKDFSTDILEHFVDDESVLHEVLLQDNTFFPQVLGQHMNPGHTIEDAWFLLDAADICQCGGWEPKIYSIVLRTLENGWDTAYGGLLHFAGVHGGEPVGPTDGVADEPMTRQLSGWDDKLWWVHSEALYTTLLCYARSDDPVFLDWHDRIFAYTFRTFPNPDPEVREWIQIRRRDGSPQEKTVALPVKDPYHIARNLVLLLELLYRQSAKEEKK